MAQYILEKIPPLASICSVGCPIFRNYKSWTSLYLVTDVVPGREISLEALVGRLVVETSYEQSPALGLGLKVGGCVPGHLLKLDLSSSAVLVFFFSCTCLLFSYSCTLLYSVLFPTYVTEVRAIVRTKYLLYLVYL